MADLDAIRAKYPAYAFLLDDPEMAGLLNTAVDTSMDPQTFQAALEQTNWWKTNSQSQRAWYALANTDPAEAAQQKKAWETQVYNLAYRNGVELQGKDLDYWANLFMPQGLAPNDPQIMGTIVQTYQERPQWRVGGGDIAQTEDQVRSAAAHDYMVPMSDADVTWWSQRIAEGKGSMDGLKSTLQTLAKGRFSAFGDLIDQGITPGQIFAPYKAAIANELEMPSADQVDLLNDPRWSQVTGKVGNDGKLRPMTLSETIQLARSQDAWKQTNNAQQLGASLTKNLLQSFGEIKT